MLEGQLPIDAHQPSIQQNDVTKKWGTLTERPPDPDIPDKGVIDP